MCAILTYARESVSEEFFEEMLEKTASRGPDMTRVQKENGGWMGFNRLSIMGLSEEGMQPFNHGNNTVICNGELYGFKDLKDYLISLGYSFKSESDCEILLPLYEKLGTKMFGILDAEFACVIYDGEKKKFIAARDPIGIRPLYYGYDSEGYIIFASEPKNLVGVTDKIMPFPPGHYYEDGEFVCYRDLTSVKEISTDSLEVITGKIHDKLLNGIKKRLDADAPVGFLLSGGLDSSLVCGVAASLSDKPLETFAIGMDIDAIDLKYAREVADYIHSNHHEVIITKEDVINAIEPVIHALGTYDITTIRASIGMYLLCKWIHENTNIKVVLT